MGAVGLRVRAGLRTRWQAWLVVALLAGIGGGIVIGAIEGAARAERAYPTFVDENKAIDVLVPGRSDFGLIGAVDLNDVVRLPQVASVADASAALLFTGRTEDGKLIGPGDLFPVASRSNALGSTMETWKMTAGRPARPFEPQEATASFLLARQLDLKVGSTIRLHFFSASSFSSIAGRLIGGFGPRLGSGTAANAADLERLANGPDLTFTITGIEASALGVPSAPRRHPPSAASHAGVLEPLHRRPRSESPRLRPVAARLRRPPRVHARSRASRGRRGGVVRDDAPQPARPGAARDPARSCGAADLRRRDPCGLRRGGAPGTRASVPR